MSGFTKLFSSITDSTIWQESDHTRLVWITMLAMCDQNGYVAASVPGLASRARVPLESCVQALEAFQAPDKWSRTPDFDGKRIIAADGGWLLLNYGKYREIQDANKRREQARIGMAKIRGERKLTDVSKVNVGELRLTQAEAEAEAEAVKTIVAALPLPEFIKPEIWEMFKIHRGKKFSTNAKNLTIKDLIKAKHAGQDPNEMLEKSIANGWKGVFSTKDKPFQTVQPDYMRGVT